MDEWPQGRIKMRSGRMAKWAQANTPAGAATEIVWENITYAEAELILQVWDSSYGIYGNITLVPSTLSGLSPGLAAIIQQPFPNTVWRAEGPPVIEAVKAKRCAVRLSLRTRRDIRSAVAYPPPAELI